MTISFKTSGSYKRTENYLRKLEKQEMFKNLSRYGQEGVRLLSASTPVETGMAARSWSYEVVRKRGSYSIVWRNSDTANGVPVVILLQYGHGTGTGGWVQGRDFINPVMRPLFDRIAADVFREVTRVG